MHRLSATYRITLGLVLLSATALLLARTLHLGPDETGAVLQGRQTFCEALAMNGSMLLSRNDRDTFEAGIQAVVDRYPEVLSAGVRRRDGKLVIQAGPHEKNWKVDEVQSADTMQVLVPLMTGSELWGALEVRFKPIVGPGLMGFLKTPFIQLVLVLTITNAVVFLLYLKRTLQHLDPAQVVPDRVRNALDTMAGGLVILDSQERIVLANKAFAATAGRLPMEMQGVSLAQFPWLSESEEPHPSLPWHEAIKSGKARSGSAVKLRLSEDQVRCYIVHCSPISAGPDRQRGVLVSFEDVTDLENKKSELNRTLEVLRASRDEIRQQNQELQKLATLDPLTGCLNRRAFYESLEVQWSTSRRYDYPLSCVMVDIDHFKNVNDTFGHSVGDLVLKKVAGSLRDSLRPSDLICRYGGEEFCILLPHTDLEHATQAAERFRRAIEKLDLAELSVTASLGAATSALGTVGPQAMIDQADASLYNAKRNGRNQVVSWEEHSESHNSKEHAAPDLAAGGTEPDDPLDLEVPFHAVSALTSALAYRDGPTADHSRRVADLCVAIGQHMFSARECYILETAALLHDIGKIGVPDAILLKPGPLTSEEWDIMSAHDRFGIEIIASAFSCPPLTRIIRNHHAWYQGNPREPGLPTGERIPLGARILALADAYDAMTSERVYEKARTQKEAIEELRRCAGTQFDPNLVEQFVALVEQRRVDAEQQARSTSRRTAIRFGKHMERLAEALDNDDRKGLAVLSDQLLRAATQAGERRMAEVATSLRTALSEERELIDIVNLTNELLTLCRATQTAFLERDVDARGTQSATQQVPVAP